ncbi:MAG: helix-turn-helix domain-containing protein [Saprospiraceae bacterium]|nr:helix-turn-helix domain-containing protein [Saprospiraceae bacterium]
MPEFNPQQNSFILELENIIERNLDNANFSIDLLCAELNLSRSQLHRKIKAATGLATTHFIRKVKLRKAALLLKTTELNISEIAYAVGIGSPQNFSKYFLEEYGSSPTNYRKSSSPAASDSIETRDTKRFKFRPLVIVAFLVLMILSAFVFGNQQSNLSTKTSAVDATQVQSIAVIPFKTFNKEQDLFLAEGIAEDILTHLASFKDLWIISRTSTEKFKNTELSIPQIAAEIGAKYILEGSVRRRDPRTG